MIFEIQTAFYSGGRLKHNITAVDICINQINKCHVVFFFLKALGVLPDKDKNTWLISSLKYIFDPGEIQSIQSAFYTRKEEYLSSERKNKKKNKGETWLIPPPKASLFLLQLSPLSLCLLFILVRLKYQDSAGIPAFKVCTSSSKYFLNEQIINFKNHFILYFIPCYHLVACCLCLWVYAVVNWTQSDICRQVCVNSAKSKIWKRNALNNENKYLWAALTCFKQVFKKSQLNWTIQDTRLCDCIQESLFSIDWQVSQKFILHTKCVNTEICLRFYYAANFMFQNTPPA